MNSWMVEVVGMVAGCLTTCSFIPQVVRTYRTRSVNDISLSMYLLLSCGIGLWIAYGVLIGSLSVIAANVVSLLLTAAILAMKVRFGRHLGSR